MISFIIISKITVNRKKIVWIWLNSTTDIILANFWDISTIFWMVVFIVFWTCENIFKVYIKSLILNQLISLSCLCYNIWTRFYLVYLLEESEVVTPKGSIKKVLLKISQNSQENICAGVSFAIKLQAEGL